MLTESGCRERQRRLHEYLVSHNIDAAAITDPHEIYYFAGVLLPTLPFHLPGFLWIEANERSRLVVPREAFSGYVSDYIEYAWNEIGTTSPDLTRRLAEQVKAQLGGIRAKRLMWQANSMPHLLAQIITDTVHPDEWIATDDVFADMQKRKDPDEIEVIRRCIQVNLAGYSAAYEAIAPGVTELSVLAAGQRGAMLAAGESVYHNGDYRCGAYNGPARDRRIEHGEIYIIDAQNCYHGYWSDLSRAFLVGEDPTPLQQSIFDHIAAVQRQVPTLLRHGADGRDIWRELDRLIREHWALAESGLIHHGGHSIGIYLHELPDINRDRGGILEIGNVMCVEPGGYTPAARFGVRIENMYLITDSGVENLSEYPVALV